MRTYGTAELSGNEWHVKAEPHVAIRLKRVFKRAGRQIGLVKLHATEEVCRDLLWFTQRYPLNVIPMDALLERAEAYDRRLESFDSLLAGRIKPRAFNMALPPRNYQRIAAEMALKARGLIIADDVGLGKTASAIAALTDPITRPALVVTLTHLPWQWESEFAKFAPDLKLHIIRKTTPYDIAKSTQRKLKRKQMNFECCNAPKPSFPDVLICNYHKLSGWAEALAGKVNTVIFDECQELRRVESQKYYAAKHIAEACDYKWGLSATPIYNFGIEFFNVMNVLNPDILGTRGEFLEEWCKGFYDADKARISDPRAFGTYARELGIMIRRTRADVGRELPHLTKSVMHVEADEGALDRMVGSSAADLAKIILDHSGAWNARGQAARELDWRLRQATGIAKAPYVADFVKLLVESGESVVLYGWHREVYNIWAEQLKNFNPAFFTGTESPAKKNESKRLFCSGESKVLIMSLRSGAGLDGLQDHCRTIVFGELDWSPGVHEQAAGRVHRDGQGDPVVAYFVVTNSGSDPVVMDVLGLKREQLDGINDPNKTMIEKLESGTDRIRKLAEHYLAQHGRKVKEEYVGKI